jgi:hypothetical protein
LSFHVETVSSTSVFLDELGQGLVTAVAEKFSLCLLPSLGSFRPARRIQVETDELSGFSSISIGDASIDADESCFPQTDDGTPSQVVDVTLRVYGGGLESINGGGIAAGGLLKALVANGALLFADSLEIVAI